MIIRVNSNEVHEPTIIPPNTEVVVRIVSIKEGKGLASGKPYIMPRLEVPAEPYAKEFNHVVMLPEEDMDEKTRNNTAYRLIQFLTAFGVDVSGEIELDIEDLIGREADAVLDVDDDPTYGEQNRVKYFVVPK